MYIALCTGVVYIRSHTCMPYIRVLYMYVYMCVLFVCILCALHTRHDVLQCMHIYVLYIHEYMYTTCAICNVHI